VETGFDFGANWQRYSLNALTADRVEEARADFSTLTEEIDLNSKTFLDVGFGQGLISFTAARAGAKVYSLDISPRCLEALEVTAQFFDSSIREKLDITVGSILSNETVQSLLEKNGDGYHVVHAWGVLHHTGDLRGAFANCVKLLGGQGTLIIAIYNRHWSSPIWKLIKRLYCAAPAIVQKLLVAIFTPIIFVAKFLVTRENPMSTERGMEFFTDIVDWVGGYPYEYASVEEMRSLGNEHGLKLVRVSPASVPTGCNEFVFSSQ